MIKYCRKTYLIIDGYISTENALEFFNNLAESSVKILGVIIYDYNPETLKEIMGILSKSLVTEQLVLSDCIYPIVYDVLRQSYYNRNNEKIEFIFEVEAGIVFE